MLVQKIFWSKEILVKKKFGQKMLVQKKFGRKNVGKENSGP